MSYEYTDSHILELFGDRIKQSRLNKNLSQEDLAERAGVSRNAVRSLEAGKGQLSSLIPVLRALRALDPIFEFIKRNDVSPIMLAENKGVARKRARSDQNSALLANLRVAAAKKKQREENDW